MYLFHIHNTVVFVVSGPGNDEDSRRSNPGMEVINAASW
jgi:hypothetical protein